MKGFKPCVKMAHGGKVRHYAEGSDGGVKAEKMDDGSQQWVRGKTREEKDDTLNKYQESEIKKLQSKARSASSSDADFDDFIKTAEKTAKLRNARILNTKKWSDEVGYKKGGKAKRVVRRAK